MAGERPLAPPHAPSAELAIRAFEAEIAFNRALSDFQLDHLPLQLDNLTDAIATRFFQAANCAGFSWTVRATHGDSVELALLHSGGAEIAITSPAAALRPTLLGLLGVLPGCAVANPQASVAAHQPAEAQAEATWLQTPPSELRRSIAAPPVPAAEPVLTERVAALAAALADPEPAAATGDPKAPLSEEQHAAAVSMVNAMTPAQRKSFSVAFRHAFGVPREEISLAPLITQIQHLGFIDRFTVEAAGGIAA